jgi:hypothetical protein
MNISKMVWWFGGGETAVANVVPPVISVVDDQQPQAGEVLEVTPGIWTGSPTLTYQWYNNQVGIIFGQTGTTYTIQPEDGGLRIWVREIPNGISADGVNSNEIYIQEDYSFVTNVIFHGDFNGLEVGTTNDYGQVDGSGNIVTWKSSPQFPTGVTFGVQGTAPTLTSVGIAFTSAGNLRHTGANSVFNNLHFREGGINDLKSTIVAVIQCDSGDRAVGICGNNGTTTLSKGIHLFAENRSSQSGDANLSYAITRGVNGSLVLRSQPAPLNPKTYPFGCFTLICVETDNSLTLAERGKLFITTARRFLGVESSSTTLATDPSHAFEIGACGNTIFRGQSIIKEIFIMDGILSSTNRDLLLQQLTNKYNLLKLYSRYNPAREFFTETGRYKFSLTLNQKFDETSNDLIALYVDGTVHTYSNQKKIVKRTSNDRGLTWSSESDVYVPSSPNAVQDPGTGYDTNGRLHIMTETITSTTAGTSVPTVKYLYSDDNGDTWSTPTDLTSILPSDGLAAYRFYGKLVENEGRIMFPFYKFTDEGTSTESANYMMYSEDYGATWDYKTIRAKGSTYINETSLFALDETHLIAVSRNEATLEWTFFSSDDNGDTWTNEGDVTFGVSMVTWGHPCRINKVVISGEDFITFYFTNRLGTNEPSWINICRKSDLISSGKAAIKNNLSFIIHQSNLTSSGHALSYGDIYFNNDLPSLGVLLSPADDPLTASPNRIYSYNLPNIWLPFVKEEYGLDC